MKRAILLFLALALASGSALAHGRSRVFLGFNFGFPVYHSWYPAYYPAPVYYPVAPVYVQPPEPPVYVQQKSDVVPEGPGTWYFCREANGYYPYVKQCPGGWQRVPAQPSN